MNISEEKKVEILEGIEKKKCLNKEDEDNLLLLSKDEDEYIRGRVADLLGFFPTPLSRQILIGLLNDKKELTRVDVCDSLCVFGDKEVVKLLTERLIYDESELVRSYAALSLGDIAYENKMFTTEILSQLITRLKKETASEHVTTSILRSLYLNDRKEEYLVQLLKALSSEHYYIRGAVVRILHETYTNENSQRIINALTALLEKEDTYAVSSNIETVLKQITPD